jgi:hypothetical protein
MSKEILDETTKPLTFVHENSLWAMVGNPFVPNFLKHTGLRRAGAFRGCALASNSSMVWPVVSESVSAAQAGGTPVPL